MVRRRHVGAGRSEDEPSLEFPPDSSGCSLWIRVLFRLLFFAYYATIHVGEVYTIGRLRNNNNITNPFAGNPYAGRWKYLTAINLVSRVWLRGRTGRIVNGCFSVPCSRSSWFTSLLLYRRTWFLVAGSDGSCADSPITCSPLSPSRSLWYVLTNSRKQKRFAVFVQRWRRGREALAPTLYFTLSFWLHSTGDITQNIENRQRKNSTKGLPPVKRLS